MPRRKSSKRTRDGRAHTAKEMVAASVTNKSRLQRLQDQLAKEWKQEESNGNQYPPDNR